MGIPKWLLGTTDGVNFVASTDKGDMPKGMIVNVHEEPTPAQISTLEKSGCNIRVIYPTEKPNAQ